MNLRAMILSHDDSALEALTSKGLLRRAQRDLTSGIGQVDAVDETNATVTIKDLTVELVAKGPEASSCNCKAHGLCRHILLAVLLLRDHPDVDEASNEAEDTVDAATFVCQLTDAQLTRFAGKDWDKAVLLAGDEPPISFENEGINITVRFTDMEASVTFIAGNDLKGAAYKGLKTRKRLLTTLAALAVRQRAGIALAESATAPKLSAGVSAQFIDQAQKTIEQAVLATLPSRSLLAYDLLLDLAISTRCEALPRLSAELRALARQTQRAHQRSIEFEADAFMLDAARSYALLEVLRSAAPDELLGGTLRRRFETHEPMEVWPLGVTRWRSDTGARGLSAHLYTPTDGRWLTLSDGRAAGAGGSFNLSSAYESPVWGVGTLSGLMGRRVKLPTPQISEQGSISSKAVVGSELLKSPLGVSQLMESSAICRNWQALGNDLRTRMGLGMRRRSIPVPALIAPTGFGRLGFDDMNQRYTWEVHDDAGESLVLDVPVDDEESALRLWRLGKKIMAIVVEARLENSLLTLRPVSVLQKQRGTVSVHNVDFDAWPIESGWKQVLGRISDSVAKPLDMSTVNEDPLGRLLADVAEHLAGSVSGAVMEGLPSVQRRLEATGMVTLEKALVQAVSSRDVRTQLRAAYLTGELRSILALGGTPE